MTGFDEASDASRGQTDRQQLLFTDDGVTAARPKRDRGRRPLVPDGTGRQLADLLSSVAAVAERLSAIEAALGRISEFVTAKGVEKEFYTTSEVATILGRAEFTVREWCRQRRCRATKKECGRGEHGEWLIAHDELTRLKSEGLLPPPT
jgi:hypothetical protein